MQNGLLSGYSQVTSLWLNISVYQCFILFLLPLYFLCAVCFVFCPAVCAPLYIIYC